MLRSRMWLMATLLNSTGLADLHSHDCNLYIYLEITPNFLSPPLLCHEPKTYRAIKLLDDV